MRIVSRPLSKTLLAALIIVVSALVAIALHAVLPVGVDESLLDGWLVKKFGFPIVAISYFLVLFSHCTTVLVLNRNRLMCSPFRAGRNLGLCFALIYMVGMQEIILSASPYAEWGVGFIYYQVLMGIGDALPVILLCLSVGLLFFESRRMRVSISARDELYALCFFAAAIGTIRLVASFSGAIDSEILDYSIPVAVWGYVLGLAFGMVHLVVTRTTRAGVRTMLLGFATNWVLFNAFIGVVKQNAMADALLRSVIDLAAISIAIGLSSWMKRRRRANQLA